MSEASSAGASPAEADLDRDEIHRIKEIEGILEEELAAAPERGAIGVRGLVEGNPQHRRDPRCGGSEANARPGLIRSRHFFL